MDSFRDSITNHFFTKKEKSMTIANHLFSKEECLVFAIVAPNCAQSLRSWIRGSHTKSASVLSRSKSIGHVNSLSSHLASSVLKDAAPAGGPHLSSANSVWVEKTLSLYPSFKETVATDYMATLNSLDFINKANEAIQTVNLWAEKETKGLIRNFLPPGSIDSLTRLVLTNALYFKGAWEQSFDASETKDYDFHLLNGTSVKVPFMTSMKRQFISAFDGFKVLSLPYKQGEDERQFSMYFFLPDVKDGLLGLIEKAATESNFLEDKLPHTKVVVGDFRIPRFNISFELEISDVLKELGVVLPFSIGGLTKIADSPISVSTVLQKSVIEVDEEGAKAAAFTGIRMYGCCLTLQLRSR